MGEVKVIPRSDEGMDDSAYSLDLDGGPQGFADATGEPLEVGA